MSDLRNGFDAGETSGLIGPFIFCTGRVVGDLSRLDIHAERSLGEIRSSSSPFDRSFTVIVHISTGPDAHSNRHGCLRVVRSIIGVCVQQSANCDAINDPDESLGGPIHCVVVEVLLDIGRNRVVESSVENSLVAFAKVIGLGMCRVSSHELPVDLVQIIGLEHNR